MHTKLAISISINVPVLLSLSYHIIMHPFIFLFKHKDPSVPISILPCVPFMEHSDPLLFQNRSFYHHGQNEETKCLCQIRSFASLPRYIIIDLNLKKLKSGLVGEKIPYFRPIEHVFRANSPCSFLIKAYVYKNIRYVSSSVCF